MKDRVPKQINGIEMESHPDADIQQFDMLEMTAAVDSLFLKLEALRNRKSPSLCYDNPFSIDPVKKQHLICSNKVHTIICPKCGTLIKVDMSLIQSESEVCSLCMNCSFFSISFDRGSVQKNTVLFPFLTQ